VFVLGRTYNRRDLHKLYGGQKQSGISTPSRHSFIMLFTGEQGHQYGYQDDWTDEGIFLYTGEGQIGDMTFVRGNRAVRDHSDDGKDLHLFKYVQPGRVRYMGQMVYIDHYERPARDREGKERRVIVFKLAPISAFDSHEMGNVAEEKKLWTEPLSVLRERALATAYTAREPSETKQMVHYRSNAVRAYVLRRADGICEGCGKEAPFTTSEGQPYLEPHHIRRLSDGGPDHPQWVAALCPNCHSRAHYSADWREFNKRLLQTISEKESRIVLLK
jgi:5-methylcytosine-specific restriction protein A